ncbi:MAG TPA: YicC/YloC family endoribonuclease [Chthoniobacterales bacterium]|jgi:uncharacterized protein (TIGR00255 family)|nr:YicC/YloC family endoribonuclease [Chthoniobacterales bacterium]
MRSMTGYGRGRAASDECKIVVELQALNKRQTEIVLSLPGAFSSLESEVRAAIDRKIHRGRINANISAQFVRSELAPKLNRQLAKAYLETFTAVQKELGLAGEISIDTLLRAPGVLDLPEQRELKSPTRQAVLTALETALKQMLVMRAKEGAHLLRDLTRRIKTLRSNLDKVRKLQPRAAERFRNSLRDRVKAHGVDIPLDDDRLAKEVAYFAERSDFSEEVSRLDSHITQFLGIAESEDSVGRTLEFLCQEIGRELNTLSAKANDAEISQLVVHSKAELEKIREQVSNVE